MAKVQSFDEMSQSGVSQLEESHISDDCAESKSARLESNETLN